MQVGAIRPYEMEVVFDLGSVGKHAIMLHGNLDVASATHCFRVGDRIRRRKALGTVKALLGSDGMPLEFKAELNQIFNLLVVYDAEPGKVNQPVVVSPRAVALAAIPFKDGEDDA
jgi:hypothetical protein